MICDLWCCGDLCCDLSWFAICYPGEMGGPGECDEENCGVVVNEHLPEVLPLHVKELAAHVCV